jgi:hypothetical protein
LAELWAMLTLDLVLDPFLHPGVAGDLFSRKSNSPGAPNLVMVVGGSVCLDCGMQRR